MKICLHFTLALCCFLFLDEGSSLYLLWQHHQGFLPFPFKQRRLIVTKLLPEMLQCGGQMPNPCHHYCTLNNIS